MELDVLQRTMPPASSFHTAPTQYNYWVLQELLMDGPATIEKSREGYARNPTEVVVWESYSLGPSSANIVGPAAWDTDGCELAEGKCCGRGLGIIEIEGIVRLRDQGTSGTRMSDVIFCGETQTLSKRTGTQSANKGIQEIFGGELLWAFIGAVEGRLWEYNHKR